MSLKLIRCSLHLCLLLSDQICSGELKPHSENNTSVLITSALPLFPFENLSTFSVPTLEGYLMLGVKGPKSFIMNITFKLLAAGKFFSRS